MFLKHLLTLLNNPLKTLDTLVNVDCVVKTSSAQTYPPLMYINYCWFLRAQERIALCLFITLVANVFNDVFLFVGLTTVGTLMTLIGWLIKLSVKTFPPLIYINFSSFIRATITLMVHKRQTYRRSLYIIYLETFLI